MVGRPPVMRFRTTLTAVSVCAALAVGAPAAFAQTASPSQEGYSTPGGAVQTELDNGNGPGVAPGANPVAQTDAVNSVQSADDASLPFTGLDVALMVGAGGMLMLLGFGIRRISRPTSAV